MNNSIDSIRNALDQLGCSLQERKLPTENGGTLWMVFCRQDKKLFCVEGSTQREAWELAWNLKGQIKNNNSEEPSMILPFHRSSRKNARKPARIDYPNDLRPKTLCMVARAAWDERAAN
jgi:hypothetical protein